MSIHLHPYIFFTGDCREAMEFYRGIFGGKLEMQAFSEVPGEVPGKEEHPDWIMHASLTGGDAELMGSDTAKASSRAAKIELSLSGTDEPKLRQAFDALGLGGTVKFPLAKQFWGDTFGMLTDKYGVDWMVNIAGK